MSSRPADRHSPWRDVASWFWEIFGPTIKAAIGPAIASGGLIWLAGWDFVRSAHSVPGYTIVVSVAVFVLCVFSVGSNLLRWRRRHHSRTLSIQHTGYPASLVWDLGTAGDKSVMFVSGHFAVTALAPHDAVVVPRSVLQARYRLWGIIPARRRVDGPGISGIESAHVHEEQLFWTIEPAFAKKGDPISARVCLVDHLGGENWTRWLRWPGQP